MNLPIAFFYGWNICILNPSIFFFFYYFPSTLLFCINIPEAFICILAPTALLFTQMTSIFNSNHSPCLISTDAFAPNTPFVSNIFVKSDLESKPTSILDPSFIYSNHSINLIIDHVLRFRAVPNN